MRSILIILFVNLSLTASSQLQLNRFYGQLDYGYSKHWSAGITAHCFGYLSSSFSYSTTKWEHDEVYYTPKNWLFREEHRLHDHANKFNFLIGATTKNLDILDISIMAGPSYINHRIYTNIAIEDYYDYNVQIYKKRFTYDLEEVATLGFAARLDLVFSFNEYFGLNLAFERTFNDVRNYHRVLVGINVGLVRDRNRK